MFSMEKSCIDWKTENRTFPANRARKTSPSRYQSATRSPVRRFKSPARRKKRTRMASKQRRRRTGKTRICGRKRKYRDVTEARSAMRNLVLSLRIENRHEEVD